MPEEIGEYCSALANGAALLEQPRAYQVWGIANDLSVTGTRFGPHIERFGNEPLENWIVRGLDPHLDLRFHETEIDGKRIVLLEIPAAAHQPVAWKGERYIRVGESKQRLRDYPEKERALWKVFDRSPFETGIAREHVSGADVLSLLDYPTFFQLLEVPLPSGSEGILSRLQYEKLILSESNGLYSISNLGVILLARQLDAFDMSRKGVRVVIYKGVDRTETVREQAGARGYAAGFAGLLAFVNSQLPANEHIGQALRTELRMFPEIAIRELVANAMIHQDFTVPGTGPMVEIFTDRVEITNPGRPLMALDRLLDAPPQSRNDALGSLMRRLGICEERGTGIDKVLSAVEFYQLPAPDFRAMDLHFRVVLFAYRQLVDLTRDDRIRACYQHTALLHVMGQSMSNATLRKRFAIEDRNYATASRIISDTMESGMIKPFDPTNRSNKHARYVPYWA